MRTINGAQAKSEKALFVLKIIKSARVEHKNEKEKRIGLLHVYILIDFR